MRNFLIVPVFVLLLCGCIDARTKRASSLANVATQTAKREYEAADTPEKKVRVADEYFKEIPPIINAVDDYIHGREPVKDPVNVP